MLIRRVLSAYDTKYQGRAENRGQIPKTTVKREIFTTSTLKVPVQFDSLAKLLPTPALPLKPKPPTRESTPGFESLIRDAPHLNRNNTNGASITESLDVPSDLYEINRSSGDVPAHENQNVRVRPPATGCRGLGTPAGTATFSEGAKIHQNDGQAQSALSSRPGPAGPGPD